MRVSVDARALDLDFLRSQGIGRYAAGLLAELPAVAAERGGELILLRERGAPESAFGEPPAPACTVRPARPPVPARAADLAEQALLPLDIRGLRAGVHHSLSLYRAPLWPGVPSVITLHDVIPLMWPERYLRTGVVHRLLYRAARRATRLIAISERARADIVARLGVGAERIDVVPPAADGRFRPTEPADVPARHGIGRPYVLYVGGLSNPDPRKGLAPLIEEFARWSRERGRGETLVLAGGLGPAAEPLLEAARASGAPIVFTGFVDDADLPALYSGASCVVTASEYEGFGMPALEAVACGTPVACFDAGALPEAAGPGGLLVPGGDVGALMGAVERLCDEPDLRKRLGRAGREHAGRFSWRRAAEVTWSAYEQALSGESQDWQEVGSRRVLGTRAGRRRRQAPAISAQTVAIDMRDAAGPQLRGWGRYARELAAALRRRAAGDGLAYRLVERGWPGPELLFEQVALPLLVRREGAAAVHAPNCFLPLRRPCPGIVTVHDLAFEDHPEGFARTTAWKYRTFTPRAARSAERVICDSAFTRDDLCARYGVDPEKVRVIPLAPALPRAGDKVERDERPLSPYVLAVGDLRPKKNFARLAAAMRELHARGLPHRLAIAGADAGEGGRILAAAGGAPVELLGYVPDARLDALIRGAGALVHPSLYEGFGLVMVEAFERGCPVAAARATALPETAGDAAAWFDPLDPGDIARTLARVLEDAGLRDRLRERGRAQAAELSWERTAAATAAVYREAISG